MCFSVLGSSGVGVCFSRCWLLFCCVFLAACHRNFEDAVVLVVCGLLVEKRFSVKWIVFWWSTFIAASFCTACSVFFCVNRALWCCWFCSLHIVSPIKEFGQNLLFVPIGLLDVYNSGGAVDTMNWII